MLTVPNTDKSTWQTVRFGDVVHHISERVQPDDVSVDRYVGLEHLDPESLKIRRWGSPDDVAFKSTINQAFAALGADKQRIDEWYLYFYLDNSYQKLRSYSQGSNQKNLSGYILQRFPIKAPPLEFQRTIVGKLGVGLRLIQMLRLRRKFAKVSLVTSRLYVSHLFTWTKRRLSPEIACLR